MKFTFFLKSESKLNSAKILLENRIYDDAISRAYYCMYYATKSILCLKGKYPRTHRGLVSQFGLEFVKEGLIEEYLPERLQQHRREEKE
jgi:uncharacterized protein (UPF0332 family)